jgi:biotin carboxyl carrier protein
MANHRYVATSGALTRNLELEALGGGRYTITVDGKPREVDARRLAGGNWSVLIDGQSYDIELEVAGATEREGAYNTLVRGHVVGLTVQDERRVRMSAGARKVKVEGPQLVKCPMPGKVVKVLVEPEQVVEDGTPLLIIEAMKMENEIRAPTKGKVTRIYVEAGQTVESHAKLVSIE